jgi:hypothetical protein
MQARRRERRPIMLIALFAILLLAIMVGFSSQVTGDKPQGGTTMQREDCSHEDITRVEVPHRDGEPIPGWVKYQFGDWCAGWTGEGRVQCVLTSILSLPWDWGFSQTTLSSHGPAWPIGMTLVTADTPRDLPLGVSREDIAINGDGKHAGIMVTFCGDGDSGDWGVQEVRIYSVVVKGNCVFLHSTYRCLGYLESYDRILQCEVV